MSQYNRREFPEFIFKDENLNVLFFEFDICFRIDFMESFAKYLQSMKVANIIIHNIEPGAIVFSRTIETEKLPAAFIDAVKTPIDTDYLESSVTLYMYTELAELYPAENENLFCLILDRSFDLALMATPKSSNSEPLNEYKIKDVREYLSSVMTYGYTRDFDNNLQRNYFKQDG